MTRGIARPGLWAALAYAALTVLLTWPVAARMSRAVPFYNDTWIFVWDVATVRAALLDPARPVFATRQVFHPEGISLAYHTLSPLYGGLAIPLEPVLGLIATYNLFFLASFWTAAWALRWLALRLGIGQGGAFLGGLLFAFSPFHQAHAPHLNLLSIAFLPVNAWLVCRFLATASWRHGLLLALSAALTFYTCLEYAFFSALIAAVFLACALLGRGRGPIPLAPAVDLLGRGVATAALALGLSGPGLVAMLAEAAVERHYFDPVDVAFSADLFSWITPSVLHSLWGGYTMKVYQHFPGVLAEWTTFVGLVAGVLGLAALRARRELPLAHWLALGAVGVVLASGPWLRILGTATAVPLPYLLLKQIPVVSAMREPSRFAALVTLVTALGAAWGFERLRHGRAGRWTWLAVPLALLELVQLPLPTSEARVPAFFSALAGEGGHEAVLDVPADLAIREHLYHQAVHGRPILLGYIARIPAASRRFVETLPLLEDPAGWDLSRTRPGESAPGERYLRLARALGVRYALVNREHYRRLGRPGSFEPAVEHLLALPGARLAAREAGFAAVDLAPPGRAPAGPDALGSVPR